MSKVPFKAADILIPQNLDMQKWSVVACDQYTSQPKYWEDVEEFVGGAPSTLNLIFPEVYLDSGDPQKRINSINETMDKYLSGGIFRCLKNSLVYVERTVAGGKVRRGVVGAVDLEAYDYSKTSKSAVRATEGTVLERIPPRVKIRINAKIELPHIMLLIDDPQHTVIEKIDVSGCEKIYDFDLMENSGHIRGYKIDESQIMPALCALADKITDVSVPLFAVGDGNHSLATAKECWEQIKKGLTDKERENHPARFPLVELVNVHDSALEFEPIHRVVFDCQPQKLIQALKSYYPDYNCGGKGQKIQWCCKDGDGEIYVENAPSNLAVGTLQKFLDDYTAENGGKIDYIHGEDVTRELAQKDNAIGFLLPAMEKSQLFATVAADGALPRKTFSMGEAWEKRFYLECKRTGI